MFVCKCGKEFGTEKSLVIHKARWCDLYTPKVFECQCGEKFDCPKSKRSLQIHRKTCEVFKEFRRNQRSETSQEGFKKSMERDPERIKRIRAAAGEKISKTIMADKDERERRSKALGTLNKTDAFRKKASETAIKTSARKDIQDNRSAALQRWRDENPEAFQKIMRNGRNVLAKWVKDHPEEHYEKCVKPLLSNWKSRPEKSLLAFCKCIVSDRKSHFLTDDIFTTKTKRRQIDIFSGSKSIIVEFDGPLHFESIFGDEDFESKKRKDAEINSLQDRYCIIRVSYDCYFYNIENFKNDLLDLIKELLLNPKNGLYLFGSKYGEDYKR